ncbi:MAG TPA: hypothetical protein VGD94_06270 [Vicinamibacterales bacterium]
MAHTTLSTTSRTALEGLASDLREIFGNRLLSVCAYGQAARGDDVQSLALVDRLTFDDLAACLPFSRKWDRAGLAVPLILERDEFVRTLDVFPLEYGEIIADHAPVYGEDPFDGLEVAAEDLRRGCEFHAKSHLIHLREAFLETGGDPKDVSRLISGSAPGYRRLLANVVALVDPANARADAHDLAAVAERILGVPAATTMDVLAAQSGALSTIADPTALLARYIEAVERLWEYVDAWRP